jgi:hypothetical protein
MECNNRETKINSWYVKSNKYIGQKAKSMLEIELRNGVFKVVTSFLEKSSFLSFSQK